MRLIGKLLAALAGGAAAFLWAATPLSAQATFADPGFSDELFAGGIARGTAMAFAPDGRLFVCEQGPGTTSGSALLKVFSTTGALLGTFHTFTVDSTGERGLLGIAIDPDFTVNRNVYAYTTTTAPANRVVRITESTTTPNTSTGVVTQVILLGAVSAGNHNGGALGFGPDGKLYIAVGENNVQNRPQDPASLWGKILRLNPDGGVPGDNPLSFQAVATPLSAPNPVWAIGLRNPFTFAFQPGTGRMYINDVGSNPTGPFPGSPNPSGPQEEINQGGAGLNFGWPNAEGSQSCATYTCPVHSYPRGTSGSIAGGAFYNPSTVRYPASYVGLYFFADYVKAWIRTLDPGTGSTAGFATGVSGCLDLDVGPDGLLYYLNRGTGEVRRVRYTGVPTQGIIVSTNAVSVAEGGSVSFGVKLAVDPGGGVTVNVANTSGDASVSVSGVPLSFTAGNWDSYQQVTVLAAQDDSDTADGGATLTLSATGIASQYVVATALDNDRPAGSPTAVIALPIQGQTVSGVAAEFFGNGTDNSGMTRAEFYVDNVLAWTDTNATGHYHYGNAHSSWNTSGLANGTHQLEMRVYDDTMPTPLVGSHRITVEVSNVFGGGGGSSGGCGLGGFEALFALGLLAAGRRRRHPSAGP
jgi:glucose/arabinose dehydrogenase